MIIAFTIATPRRDYFLTLFSIIAMALIAAPDADIFDTMPMPLPIR